MLSAFTSSLARLKGTRTARLTAAASLAVIGCFFIVLALSLFMPKRDIPHCVHIVPLGAGATIQHNCDSLLIAQTADDLGNYFAEPSMWRTRPAHILFVSGIGRVLGPFTSGLTDDLVNRLRDVEQYLPNAPVLLKYYYAAILFNVLIVALAYFGTTWLLPAQSPMQRIGIAGAIASFDITLAWFWVPHQILMNLLVPIGSVIAFVLGTRLRHLTRLQIAALGLVSALFTLAYPYALVWTVTFGVGGLYGWQKWTAPGIREAIARFTIYATGFGSLMVAWFMPYLLVFGDRVSHEANLGQFQWLPVALQEGQMFSAIALHVGITLGFLFSYNGLYGLVLLLTLLATSYPLVRSHSARALLDPVLLGVGATMVAMLLFNFFQGYHPRRLLLFPVLLLVIATSRILLLLDAHRTAAGYLFVVAATQVALGFARPALSQE